MTLLARAISSPAKTLGTWLIPIVLWNSGWLLSCATAGTIGDASSEGVVVGQVDEDLTGIGGDVRDGVYDDRIMFGQSAAFTGPASELGMEMRSGIEIAFREANSEGGIHGRALELVSHDDSYEPEAAIENTHALIEDEGVFALIGAVGTPTSRSAVPIAAEEGVPYVAPFTGAAFLRDPMWRNIINVRASYDEETEEMVDRLTSDLGLSRIAVMYQDDSFGRAGFQGVSNALRSRGLSPVSIGIYPRNTTAIKTALLDIRYGDPEAVILVGAYKPVARLIEWSRSIEFDPTFVTISFVGGNALAAELGPDGTGVFMTQVVPFPEDESVSVVSQYLEALEDHVPGKRPGFVSLEGYIAGRLVVDAVEKCGRDIDRSCFLEVLRRGESIDLGGFELRFGENDNQGSDAVYLTVIGTDGRLHPVSSMRDPVP